MRTFEELKQELLNRAKNAGACANGLINNGCARGIRFGAFN